ncbi:MAG: hypothetical protein ACRCXD_18475 [Luteolibacter sp.]
MRSYRKKSTTWLKPCSSAMSGNRKTGQHPPAARAIPGKSVFAGPLCAARQWDTDTENDLYRRALTRHRAFDIEITTPYPTPP